MPQSGGSGPATDRKARSAGTDYARAVVCECRQLRGSQLHSTLPAAGAACAPAQTAMFNRQPTCEAVVLQPHVAHCDDAVHNQRQRARQLIVGPAPAVAGDGSSDVLRRQVSARTSSTAAAAPAATCSRKAACPPSQSSQPAYQAIHPSIHPTSHPTDCQGSHAHQPLEAGVGRRPRLRKRAREAVACQLQV